MVIYWKFNFKKFYFIFYFHNINNLHFKDWSNIRDFWDFKIKNPFKSIIFFFYKYFFIISFKECNCYRLFMISNYHLKNIINQSFFNCYILLIQDI